MDMLPPATSGGMMLRLTNSAYRTPKVRQIGMTSPNAIVTAAKLKASYGPC